MKMRAGVRDTCGSGDESGVANETDRLALPNNRASCGDCDAPRDHMRIPAHYIITVIDDKLGAVSPVISFLAQKHYRSGNCGNHRQPICITSVLREIQCVAVLFYVRRRSIISLRHHKALSFRVRQLDDRGRVRSERPRGHKEGHAPRAKCR